MNSELEDSQGAEKGYGLLLKKGAPFIAANRGVLQVAGFIVFFCFAGYFYWQYDTNLKMRTAEKVEDAAMITNYIQTEVIRIMGSGRFQNLEGSFKKIKEMAKKKGVVVNLYRADGREAFSDNETAHHVLDQAKAAQESREDSLANIPVPEIIAEAEEVLRRGRPQGSNPYFDDPVQAHDKFAFEKALQEGISEDRHMDAIEKFIRVDREECGEVCHLGENAIIKMIINKNEIKAGLASDFKWGMAKVAAFVIALLSMVWLFGEFEEISRQEREKEREKYLDDLEDAYGKLQNLTSQLSEKNEAIGEYAHEMERLAEERSRQLIHADRMATLGIMAAGVAHEINNPTAFIKANADILKMFWNQHMKNIVEKVIQEGMGDMKKLNFICEEMPKLISSLGQGVSRITNIVDGLKGFSRREESIFVPASIGECIRDAVKFSQFNTTLKNEVRVELDLAEDIPDFPMSKQEIEQVLINLFTNAAHAMEGIKGARLSITAKKRGENMVVVVADNGEGMDQKTLDNIFTPFFTTKSKDGGTGLGLPICYGIIEKHGGSIKVDSTPGKGSTFTLAFPMKESS